MTKLDQTLVDDAETQAAATTRLLSLWASRIAPVSAHSPPPPHSGSNTTLVRMCPSSVRTPTAIPSDLGNRFPEARPALFWN